MKFLYETFNLLNSVFTLTADAVTTELTFEPQRFVDMLGYMGKGMIVIFVLIGVIILVTMLINKVFSKNSRK